MHPTSKTRMSRIRLFIQSLISRTGQYIAHIRQLWFIKYIPQFAMLYTTARGFDVAHAK